MEKILRDRLNSVKSLYAQEKNRKMDKCNREAVLIGLEARIFELNWLLKKCGELENS